MDIKMQGFDGIEELMKVLEADTKAVMQKVVNRTLAEMFNRAVQTADATKGGTPFKTGELRLARAKQDNRFGYTKDYAPHVEYGHKMKTKNGEIFVQGQKFLKRNRDIQEPIFVEACKQAVGKTIGK